jgi:hypothetical protein
MKVQGTAEPSNGPYYYYVNLFKRRHSHDNVTQPKKWFQNGSNNFVVAEKTVWERLQTSNCKDI